MEKNAFLIHMKTHDKQYLKVLVVVIAVFVILGVLLLKVNAWRADQVKHYSKQQELAQKVSDTQKQYENNKLALQSGALKKVLDKSRVETYQANLLKMLENNNIKVQSINVLKNATKDINTLEYESTWLGSWSDTMKALKVMETEPIAINFLNIKMEVTDVQTIRTTVKYKIYLTN